MEWFKQFGFDAGPFGTAETLSKGIDTSIDGLERGGVLKSRAGKVKLLSVQEIPDLYDPRGDERTSEWEVCLYLAKALELRGASDAAALMTAARDVPSVNLDDVQELAYLRRRCCSTTWVRRGRIWRMPRGRPGPRRRLARQSSRWSSGAMTMATSNRDRIDQGLQLLGAGLRPFVDTVMSGSVLAP